MNQEFSRFRRFTTPRQAASEILLALSLAACSSAPSHAAPPTHDAGVATAAEGGGGCSHDDECRAAMPETTPPLCAEARCVDAACVYSAKDEDGDGHPASACSASGSIEITTGDDCDDHDAHLYPGHSVPCSTAPDGGPPGGTVCVTGAISCEADGSKSACEGTVACSGDEACEDHVCSTLCKAGDVACGAEGQPVKCIDDKWQASGPACMGQACVNGACAGTCAPESLGCVDGVTPGICDDTGTLEPSKPCEHQACFMGFCHGECTPGDTSQCVDGTPGLCDANGDWGFGAPCGPDAPACIGGKCVPCSPGEVGACADDVTPTVCDGSGSWQNAAPCVNQACVNGACSGVCAPGAMDCADGITPEKCGDDGTWTKGNACTDQACSAGACVGVCAPGAASCAGGDVFSLQPQTCSAGGEWVANGPACAGQYCSATGCGNIGEQTTTTPINVKHMTADGSHLYWTDWGSSVWKLNIAGAQSGIPALVASGQHDPSGIAVDANDVYWTTDQGVLKTPIAGGTITTVASPPGTPHGTGLLSIHGSRLYWIQDVGNEVSILGVSVTGGTVTTLITAPQGPVNPLVDGTNAYWVDLTTGAVMKLSLSGGTPAILAVGSMTGQLAIDATDVYWLEDDGSLFKTPIAGAGTRTALFQGAGASFGGDILLAQGGIFWTDNGTGDIRVISTLGGSARTIANQLRVAGIAFEGSTLYWATDSGITGAFGQ